MSRIIAIDYGRKRTGIAVTDPLQIIANGLATVPTHQLISFLDDYIQQEQVEKIVFGRPVQTNGEPSENLKRVEEFVRIWKKRHPEISTDYYDERFTSVIAHQTMLDAGLKKKARQDKALVDTISATIILQGYMERNRL